MGNFLDKRPFVLECSRASFIYEADYKEIYGGKIELSIMAQGPVISYYSPEDLVHRALTRAIGGLYVHRMIRPNEFDIHINLCNSGKVSVELLDKGTSRIIIDAPAMKPLLYKEVAQCYFDISDQDGIRKLVKRLQDGYPALKMNIQSKKWSLWSELFGE